MSSVDRIDDVGVFVTSPGRNYVTVKITTEDGVVGLGDATLNGRELAVASCLTEYIVPMLLGLDSDRIEDTWQYLYKGAYWRQGAVGMACISAVDMALWDIKAKRAAVPLYQLLGGASRDRCLAYTHTFGATVPDLLEAMREKLADGFTALRVQVAIPSVGSGYGVSMGSDRYEPAVRGAVRVEEPWDTSEYLRLMPRVFNSVREEFGDSVELLHDAHHRLTPIEAARLARDLEPYRLFWLEDVVPSEDQAALRLVRQHSVTPLAIGEVFTGLHEAQAMMQERLIDYLRSSTTHAGGVTHLRRMFDFASVFNVKSACHGPSDISPIGLAASLHLGLAIPNFGIQEFMGYGPLVDDVFSHAFYQSGGSFHPGEAPGLGVEFDEAVARAHPYVRAYLPVNRLADGSMHHW